jgi:hypothetical protein
LTRTFSTSSCRSFRFPTCPFFSSAPSVHVKCACKLSSVPPWPLFDQGFFFFFLQGHPQVPRTWASPRQWYLEATCIPPTHHLSAPLATPVSITPILLDRNHGWG